MTGGFKRRLGVVVAVAAVAAFASGAYAAAQDPGTSSSSSFWGDVAHRLNVSPQQLRSAIQGAMLDRVNAAVTAGRLSKSQADAIKQRIEQSGGPPFPGPRLFGGPPFPGPLFGGPPRFFHRFDLRPSLILAAAAKYLGLSTSQLRSELAGGKTLKQIASARGKSLSGLRQAIMLARPGFPPRFFRSRGGPSRTTAARAAILKFLRTSNRSPSGFSPRPAGLNP